MKKYISICFSVLLLSSCTEEKSIDTLLNTVHKAMVKQDSVMKAAHDKLNKNHTEWQKEFATVSGGVIDSANIKLEQAHVDLLEKHDDIIDKHEVILRMHKRLIEKYQNGVFDKSFIEEQHILLEEEYKLMQADHDQLLADHEKLEKDHRKLIENLNTTAKN